ncbi:uncharacterized protein LOC144630206 [Oculina patagonica]
MVTLHAIHKNLSLLQSLMALSSKWRCIFWFFCFLCVIAALSIFVLTVHLKRCDQNPFDVKYDKRYHAPWFKESITKELNEVHLEMQKLLIYKQAPLPRLVQRLGDIVKRLDNKQQQSTTIETVNKDGAVDVCPEEYQGSSVGYPYFAKKGWYTTNCTNAKPIHSVVSILVNTVTYPKEDEIHVEKVLKGITETYPTVHVHLATQSNNVVEAAKNYKNVDVVKVDDGKLSKGWNMLISKVSTPYVLVARDVFHFTWLTQLERQIRVISQIPNVGVVGGAYRNLSGHWKAGCVQTKLKNYVLEYQEGYYHSKNECMFCDYLQGPFVTKTKMLKLDESLPNEVVFEDWFLRVVEDGALIMACPDAMYFATDYYLYPKRNDKNVWTPLAKKWELNRVLLPGGIKHSFSCQDIGFKCDNYAQSGLLPVCCQELYAEVVSFLKKFTDEHNVRLELDSGSVLGGVKFNGLIPWDIDGDFFVFSKDIEIFNNKDTIDYFQKNGYSLTGYESPNLDRKDYDSFNGYVGIDFNGFGIEIFGTGMPAMSNTVFLPAELQKPETFTKADIRGNWIDTKFSPGLYARNRYGREILKHSQSWRKVGLEHSYAEYKPGSFKPCENPKHHACVHSFPGDGNIPFLVT